MADEGLVQLLQLLGSPDKAARQQAEAHYTHLRATSAPQLLRGLIQVARADAATVAPQVKSMACVLLRQLFDPKFVGAVKVATMDPALLDEVRQGLVAAVASETQAAPRRRLGHALAQVAAALPEGAQWPELLQLTAQLMGAPEASRREAGFELLDKVAEYRATLLLPFAGQLSTPLGAGMGDAGSPEVRLAALKATCSVVWELGRQGQGAEAAFRPLVEPMLRVLEAVVKAGEGQEEAAQEAIGALSKVTEEVPKFWGEAVGTSVGPMLAALVGAGDGVDCAVRVAAIDWAAVLAEKAPARFRRGDWMANALLPALLDLACTPPPPLDGSEEAWGHRAGPANSMGDLHDGEEEAEDLAEAAVLAFDRLAKALGAKHFYKAAAPRLLAALQEQDDAQRGWCRRRGALYALAMMAEGCESALAQDLPQLLPFLLRFAADPHPRVRYALLVCLEQLCEDVPAAPDGKTPFQKAYAAAVLPALAAALRSEANAAYPRVLAAAASAVASFCDPDKVSAKIIGAEPLEGLLRALFHLLTAAPLFVREEAMTAVATLAQVVGEGFVPYYDTFVPPAKQILAEATAADTSGSSSGKDGEEELSMLGLKALEAFALMGDAVGRERFRGDAHEVLRHIAGLHERKGSGLLKAAGPHLEAQAAYLMNSTARIGAALGKEFAPYLAQVLPVVLEAAARRPTYRVRTAEGEGAGGEAVVAAEGGADEGEEEAREGDQRFGVEVRGGGRFEVMVNSWEIQQREVACQSLVLYVESLGSVLAPYLPSILRVVLDLITPTATPDVRICAYHVLPKLLRWAFRAGGGMGAELGSEALNAAVRRLLEGMAKEAEMVDGGSEDTLDVLCAAADALSLALEAAHVSARRSDWTTVTLADALVSPTLEILQATMVGNIRRRVALQQEVEVLDEEDADLLEQREESEQDLMNNCQEALGWILRLKGAAALEPFQRLVYPLVQPFLAEGNSLELRLLGLCIHLDVLEFGGPGAAALAPTVVRGVLDMLREEDEDCRQTAAYGVGVLAQHGGEALDAATLQQKLLPALLALIVPPKNQPPPEPGCVRDNAISSVLRVWRYRAPMLGGTAADAARLLHEGALAWLPLQEDLREAHSCHAHFVEWAASGDPALFGPQGEHLQSVVGALSALMVDQRPEEDRVLDAKGADDGDAEEKEDEMWAEQYVGRQTRLDIEACLAGIQARFPPEVLAGAWAALDEERRRAVQMPTANVFRQQQQ